MSDVCEAPAFVERRLGRRDYEPVRDAMRAFTLARDDATADELWVVEHPPVYTLGQAGRLAHVHGVGDVPVVQTERGGQITYHGPGQVVVYPLVDLRRRGIKVRTFVDIIEDSVIETLAAYTLASRTKAGAPGVYVQHAGSLAKIAALGVRIANGRSYHGLALNVAMDLAPFLAIDPCGYADLEVVDLRTMGVDAAFDDVAARLVAVLKGRIHDATR